MNTTATNLDLSWWNPSPRDGSPLARIFGVRHLSPAAAHHLHAVLDVLRPTAVLVEGPSDAVEQIKHLTHKDTRPPVALLAYTEARPVRSILYPLAEYSPEWVALTWGLRNKADVAFIDLPAAVFLELHQITQPPEDEADGTGGKQRPVSEHTRAYLDDPYEAIARLSGEPDHETWWERHFEHTVEPAAYVQQIFEFGRGLRDWRALPANDENLIREAFMRRGIRAALARGHKPERVVVVCGAFHAPALTHDLPPMTDREVKALPQVAARLTLMPYSYARLSSQSGYGAGNNAPAYYQMLFEERRDGRKERLPARFLSELAHHMRREGIIRSAAEVIEAVRLADTLAALAGACAPSLRDLRDAAVTCLGRGEYAAIKPFLGEIETGSHIGHLPKGAGRTPIQDDFYYLLKDLKLQDYQTGERKSKVEQKQRDLKEKRKSIPWDCQAPERLELDLREDRDAKTMRTGFRDLNRSTWLHRLRTLEIDFAETAPVERHEGTWKERWLLKWTPESEIQLVEAGLKGDTIAEAAARTLSEQLAECDTVDQAALLVQDSVKSDLHAAFADAQSRLQSLATRDSAFDALARAVDSLAETLPYGEVRKFELTPLHPLLERLFLKSVLQLKQSCTCDDDTAKRSIAPAIESLHDITGRPSLSEFQIDRERWHHNLKEIAADDALNSFLSGFACALLLDRGYIDEQELTREVSRRLSPGIHAEVGAGWFEGLVSHNRQALFSRLALWRQLDAYLVSLDDEKFRQGLVYLRRAFSEFAPGEVRRVVSNLVEISQEGAEELKASVETKLSDDEAAKLQEMLGDLDL
jgi:hypothetical protein